MAVHALTTSSGHGVPATADPARCRVILDGGTAVELVLVDQAAHLRVGDRLSCRGTTWRIWSYRRHAKAFVAHPAEC